MNSNKTTRKPTYIALTTHNYQMSGMNIVVAAGHDRNKVQQYAEETISKNLVTPTGTDIYADTELKNLRVVSKTEAMHRYGFDFNEWCYEEGRAIAAGYADPNDTYKWFE